MPKLPVFFLVLDRFWRESGTRVRYKNFSTERPQKDLRIITRRFGVLMTPFSIKEEKYLDQKMTVLTF